MEESKFFKRASLAKKSIWALVIILLILNATLLFFTFSLFYSSEVMLVINLFIVISILLFTGVKWFIISPYIKKGVNLQQNTQRYRD